MLMIAAVSAEAQQPVRAPFDAPVQPQRLPIEWPVPGVLERGTSDLGVGRATLGNSLMEDTQLPSQRRSVLLDSLKRRLTITNQKRQLKYSEINKRLDRLEGVLLRKQQPMPAAAPKPLIPVPQAVPEPPTPAVVPEQPEPKRDLDPTSEVKPKPDPLPAPPTVVTTDAVDRIALADNLFASNQLEMALPLYFELSKEKHSAKDLIWIHYQIASTSRRLRKPDQARKHYRIVAGQKSDGLYPRLSRWWLDTIQRRITLEAKQNEILSMLPVPQATKVSDATK
jgi:hypothetical protein